jgi:hypothetical protein
MLSTPIRFSTSEKLVKHLIRFSTSEKFVKHLIRFSISEKLVKHNQRAIGYSNAILLSQILKEAQTSRIHLATRHKQNK